MPVTTPDVDIDAMVGALLVQLPPEGVPDKVMVLPTQTVAGPLMTAPEVIVIGFVTKLAPTVYVIVAEPAETPVTTPVELTVATEGLLLLHVPPAVLSVSVIEVPTHVDDGPTIGPIVIVPVVTVNVMVLKQPVGRV